MDKEQIEKNFPVYPYYAYPNHHSSGDEIDLGEFFYSIISQWKLLFGITILGTFLVLAGVLLFPKKYQIVAEISRPSMADIMVIRTRLNNKFGPTTAFDQYLEYSSSAENFKAFLIQEGWLEKLIAKRSKLVDKDKFISRIVRKLETNVIKPKIDTKFTRTPQGELAFENLSAEVVAVELTGKDEDLYRELLADYLDWTNELLLQQFVADEKNSVKLRTEQINKRLDLLRLAAKQKRELVISKIETENAEKIAKLSQEKTLLLNKEKQDKQTRLAVLNEALIIAKKMNIKKPTTLDSLASENSSVKTTVSLRNKDAKIMALMGTIYLTEQIELITHRQNDELFIGKLTSINKQIDEIKNDQHLKALKERKSDDPFIEEIPGLLGQLNAMERLNLDFSGARLFKWNQKPDVEAERPRRLLIVVIGFFISGFFALIFVLINNSLKKRKEKNSTSSEVAVNTPG